MWRALVRPALLQGAGLLQRAGLELRQSLSICRQRGIGGGAICTALADCSEVWLQPSTVAVVAHASTLQLVWEERSLHFFLQDYRCTNCRCISGVRLTSFVVRDAVCIHV